MSNAARYTTEVCAAGAGTVIDTADAAIHTMDNMLGDLIKMNIKIDIIKASEVGKGLINSIVGHHTDTVILMLEGLFTVCAGTLAVQNYKAVFSTLLNVLGYVEKGLRVGAAGSILYAIGSVTHLLSEKLKTITGEKAEELKAISVNLAKISTDIRNTKGEDVNENTIRVFGNEIRDVLEPAQRQAAQAEQREEARTVAENNMPDPREAQELRAQEAAASGATEPAEAEAAASGATEPAEAGDGTHTGGKKHKKSQKKPRKKASKSKRSKKAGKKTRKSRKKTRGKKH